MGLTRTIGRLAIALLGIALAGALGLGLFWAIPAFTPIGLSAVVLALVLVVPGGLIALRIGRNLLPDYNVAEVEVKGPITRDGGPGGIPIGAVGAAADDLVEQIERADADRHAKGLIVRLNTPGGAVVPSEDIRAAVERFDGPTVAYAEDTAASGGYWIATGADEIHAREGAIVGSIGVNATQLGREGLREKLGLEYRRFVAGEYKDTPSPWRELGEDEIAYFQGVIDEYYDEFVDTVAAGTDLEPEAVRETEARVYRGRTALEEGLVDHCGPRAEMEERLAETLGVRRVVAEEFEPSVPFTTRMGRGARGIARALGEGVASVLVAEKEPAIRV